MAIRQETQPYFTSWKSGKQNKISTNLNKDRT